MHCSKIPVCKYQDISCDQDTSCNQDIKTLTSPCISLIRIPPGHGLLELHLPFWLRNSSLTNSFSIFWKALAEVSSHKAGHWYRTGWDVELHVSSKRFLRVNVPLIAMLSICNVEPKVILRLVAGPSNDTFLVVEVVGICHINASSQPVVRKLLCT